MKGIILLNGTEPENKIQVSADDVVICCDGAYLWAKDKVSKIDLITGDFDSLGYIPENADVYPCEKDETDGEIALKTLIKKGVSDIEIYGGGGGREDHFFGNLQLLYLAYKNKINAVMRTEYSNIYCKGGTFTISGIKGKTFSLAPVGLNAHIMYGSGAKYPLDNLTLRAGTCRGISNIALLDEIEINCDKGALFIFCNR